MRLRVNKMSCSCAAVSVAREIGQSPDHKAHMRRRPAKVSQPPEVRIPQTLLWKAFVAKTGAREA
jgi:hypothetical protein